MTAAQLAAAPLQALVRAMRRAYIDMLIRSAEGDLRWMQHQCDHAETLPTAMAIHRDYISALRVERISL